MLQLLLDIPSPTDFFAGGLGEVAKKDIQEDSELLPALIALFAFYLCLTEPLKVLARQNIGKRALNIYGIIAGCILYFTLALAILFAIIPVVTTVSKYISYINNYGSSDSPIPVILLFILLLFLEINAAIYWFRQAFIILHRGMDEHFRAKYDTSELWQVLEYRGDSRLQDKFAGVSQYERWRLKEPNYFLMKGLKYMWNPLIGLPLIFSALVFRINEWYHVHYKWKQLRDSYLDMKIEMQKANLMYHQPSANNNLSRVSTD